MIQVNTRREITLHLTAKVKEWQELADQQEGYDTEPFRLKFLSGEYGGIVSSQLIMC